MDQAVVDQATMDQAAVDQAAVDQAAVGQAWQVEASAPAGNVLVDRLRALRRAGANFANVIRADDWVIGPDCKVPPVARRVERNASRRATYLVQVNQDSSPAICVLTQVEVGDTPIHGRR